ncbi:MAG: polysaccharide biosynthesis/export family protein [Planctomycetota bacterium]
MNTHCACVLSLVFVAGCYSPEGRKHKSGEFRTERNPSPIDSGGNSVGEEIGTKAYQIGAEDAVEIAAPGFPEFTGQFPVNEEGHIILKDIGMRLYVEGMTEVELEALLRDRISAYVKGDPALLVNVTKAVSRKYYVMGAVESQGEHTMGRRTVTVRDALLTSGWMGENAALTRVHLIRPSAEKPDYTVVDANAILYHGRLRDNLEVKPGDIVFVPTTYYSEFNSLLDKIIRPAGRIMTLDTIQEYMNDRRKGLKPSQAAGGMLVP